MKKRKYITDTLYKQNQPRPQGFFSHPFFEGKALGTRLERNKWHLNIKIHVTLLLLPRFSFTETL